MPISDSVAPTLRYDVYRRPKGGPKEGRKTMTSDEPILIPPKDKPKRMGDFQGEQMAALPKSGQTESRRETFKGLCVDCEHRHQCALCHTPGGVWNCNEYE